MDYPVFIIDQLSQQLQALRKSRGWSQTELARRLGVTQARVTTIERNPSVVGVGQLFEILQLLDAQLVLRDLQTPAPSSGAVTAPAAEANYTPKGEW
jgi:HTH-type transcriptional regulator/antitoxin HipB